jgi:hypothetical protein
MTTQPLPQRIRAVVLEAIKTTVLTPGLAEALADRITVRIGELLQDEGLI